MACSGAFGTPGWVRTSGLSLRRRPLYPTELRGLIQKIFNFRVQPDSNELPLRRRTLYPAELRTHTTPGISVNEYARCVVPVVGLEPTRCCHQRILSRTFERANKVKIRRYNPFKVRIKAHCAALFPRWSVKSIAASNNLKAWFDFNHYNAFWSKITDAFTTFGWQILIV